MISFHVIGRCLDTRYSQYTSVFKNEDAAFERIHEMMSDYDGWAQIQLAIVDDEEPGVFGKRSFCKYATTIWNHPSLVCKDVLFQFAKDETKFNESDREDHAREIWPN